MPATDSFYNWFYTGLNGLGGWFLFLLASLAANIWLHYDSSTRKLNIPGWRLGIILAGALLVPAMIFRFSGVETQMSLAAFVEWIFYLGLLGGVLPPVLAVGYYVTYRDMATCSEGHIYPAELGSCPECAKLQAVSAGGSFSPGLDAPTRLERQPPPSPMPPVSPQPHRPSRPKANALLVASNGHRYDLYQGRTSVGRNATNDVVIDDKTVSRDHAVIQEQTGRFYLTDVGSSAGTYVNDHRINQRTLLEPNDEIDFGDVRLTFVSY